MNVFTHTAGSNASATDSISFDFYAKHNHGEDERLDIKMMSVSVEELVRKAEKGAFGMSLFEFAKFVN